MPEVRVRKLGNKYRLIETGSNKIARMVATGAARDGGGHASKAKAIRQAGYVNDAVQKLEKK